MSPVIAHFLLPCEPRPFARLPQRLADYAEWQATEKELSPFVGRIHWVLQTWLQLREAGADVKLVRTWPNDGLVITHVECLPYGVRPPDSCLLVPMLVDKGVPLPRAAFHITHNPVQRLPLSMPHQYMPPWPQIGLLPRDPTRNTRFETLAFMGYEENLHPDLTDRHFQSALAELRLALVTPPATAWHDFSNVDAVLAIRNFGRADAHLTKPALKLFNAWLAGVPAIIGHESAYRFEGRPGLDYLEATTPTEALSALTRLAHDPDMRASLVIAGRQRLQYCGEQSLRAAWIALLEQRLFPLYQRWQKSSALRTRLHVAAAFRERILWRRPGWFLDTSGDTQ